MINTRNTSRRSATVAPRRAFCFRGGFTLLEIMFAIMILGVGLVAVASLFPVTSRMQKNTFDDMIGMQMVSNVKAALLARGIAVSDAEASDASAKTSGNVYQLPIEVLNRLPNDTGRPDSIEWMDHDRSFPVTAGKLNTSGTPDTNGNGINDGWEVRPYFWEPLVRYDTLSGLWEVYVIVYRTVGSKSYGIETGDAADLAVGEMGIMVNGGAIVYRADPATTLTSGACWHAVPVGQTTTTVRIIKLTGGVVR
jgi:prepilin-type N-terminal cleavage/methylation domain-containing protein